MNIAKLTIAEKDRILKEITEWMYIHYGDVEIYMCPLCENVVDLPQIDPKFIHLRDCPFYKVGDSQ